MENCYELMATIEAAPADVAGFNLCVGDGRKVSLSYDVATGYLTLDRTNCSDVKIKFFDRISTTPVAAPGTRKINLRIFVDKSTVEVFADNGRKVMTLLTYAAPSQTGVEFFSQRGPIRLALTAWPMQSIHD